MVRTRLLAVLVAGITGIAALAGCGGTGSDDSGPDTSQDSPSGSPSRTVDTTSATVGQLRQALESVRSVKGVQELTGGCPKPHACPDGTVVSLQLELADDGAARAEEMPDSVLQGVYAALLDAGTAAKGTDRDRRIRKRLARYDGHYAFKEKQTGDHTTVPGEDGSGTVRKADRDGWHGIVADRRGTITVFERVSPAFPTSSAYFSAGRYAVSINVATPGSGLTSARARKVLNRVLDAFFDTLAKQVAQA